MQQKWLASLAPWTAKNVDGVLALVVSVVIVVLELISSLAPDKSNPGGWLANNMDNVLNSGIILVLGVLAVTILRDRHRKEEVDDEVRALAEQGANLVPAVEALRTQFEGVSKALDDSAMVRVLNHAEVAQALAEGRRSTDRWLFRGGTGTYMRAVTLGDCIANARRDRRSLLVRLEIIDPTNVEVCATYARFRRSLSVDQTEWTPERARRESYATIVAAAWHRQRYELLDIEVGLSPVMPTLRWDLSSRSLLITHEGPRGVALLVESGKLLYDYTQTELRKSFEQTRRVPLDRARNVQLSDEPARSEVLKLFATLDMPLPASFINADIDDIVNRTLHAENPYDR